MSSRRRIEKFFGPWQEEWGKLNVFQDNERFGIGIHFSKASMGTRVGDLRRRFTYTLGIEFAVWRIELMCFRSVA